MTMTVIRLSRWEPEHPNVFGPIVEVIVEKIVAIEPLWNSSRNEEYCRLHFMGGGTMGISQSREQVWNAMAGDPLPVRVQHG